MKITAGSDNFSKIHHVLVDGVDVINSVFEADDIEGYALLYKFNENNQFYFDNTGTIAKEKRTGKIEIIFTAIETPSWVTDKLHILRNRSNN